MDELLVDPVVSRRKFDREVEQYRALESSHRARGWFLLKADFPTVEVLFAAAKVKPVTPLAFGVVIDFTNYDLWPPSVVVVDPLTWRPLTLGEARQRSPIVQIRRQIIDTPAGPREGPPIQYDLLQAYSLDEVPFLCLPGVREYHSNAAHTGDSWLLHRGRGEGTLNFILEQLHQFGVDRVAGFLVQYVPQIIGLQFTAGKTDEGVLRD